MLLMVKYLNNPRNLFNHIDWDHRISGRSRIIDGEGNVYKARITWVAPWASYQIRTIAGCACARNAGNVFPHCRFQRKPLVSDPGMHHGTCVTHVPWCMSGSLTRGDGENVPGIPGACAPAILRIWQEAHDCWWVSTISQGICWHGANLFGSCVYMSVLWFWFTFHIMFSSELFI